MIHESAAHNYVGCYSFNRIENKTEVLVFK